MEQGGGGVYGGGGGGDCGGASEPVALDPIWANVVPYAHGVERVSRPCEHGLSVYRCTTHSCVRMRKKR